MKNIKKLITSDLSSEVIAKIYTGEITKLSEVAR